MSSFEEELDAFLAATENSDRDVPVAATLEIRFKSKTVRLWGGMGSMITPDGNRWLGWIMPGDGTEPQSMINIGQIDDVRAGTSAPVLFELGYLDAESYALLRADEEETDGRLVLVGMVFLKEGTTRALTQPGNVSRLRLAGGAGFRESRERRDDNSQAVKRSVSVKALGLNAGRSRIGSNKYTQKGHEFRSLQIHGVANDLYGQFFPRYEGGVTHEL